MAEAGTGFLEQLKSCIVWSWTYLWTLWFFLMLFLVYILRVPLKINDNLTTGTATATGTGTGTGPGGAPGGARGRRLGPGEGAAGPGQPRGVLGARSIARGFIALSFPASGDAAPGWAAGGARRCGGAGGTAGPCPSLYHLGTGEGARGEPGPCPAAACSYLERGLAQGLWRDCCQRAVFCPAPPWLVNFCLLWLFPLPGEPPGSASHPPATSAGLPVETSHKAAVCPHGFTLCFRTSANNPALQVLGRRVSFPSLSHNHQKQFALPSACSRFISTAGVFYFFGKKNPAEVTGQRILSGSFPSSRWCRHG